MNIIPELKPKDKQEVQAKRQEEYKFLASIRRVRGLKLYEYNTQTKELKEAEMKHKLALSMETMKPSETCETTYRQGCVYIQALNIENARKKIKRLEEQK